MKHIKKYENIKNDNDNKKIYYGVVIYENLDLVIDSFIEFNIPYTLFLLKDNNNIVLIAIISATDKQKNYIKHIIFLSNDIKTVKHIISMNLEDVTNLSKEELKDIFETHEQAKKYNL